MNKVCLGELHEILKRFEDAATDLEGILKEVQGDVGERMARVELGYNHGLLELKKNYSLSDAETDRMASTSQIKRLKDNLFTDVTSTAKTGVSEGTAVIKKEV